MSITNDDSTDTPDPRDDPEAVIREAFSGHREEVERLAAMDMGVLSEDAQQILEVLDQEEDSE